MWRGRRVQQGRCHNCDCDEGEEHYTKRNLRRLIHTVQRLPSNRSRLDTTSLWNLVGELETFSPPLPKRSVQSTNTDKKLFSKKYLNVRLYPSASLSSADSSPQRTKLNNNRNPQLADNDSKSKNVAFNNKSKQLQKIKPQKQKDPNKNLNKSVLDKTTERKKEIVSGVSHPIKNKDPIKTIHAKTTKNICKTKTETDNTYIQSNVKINENTIQSKTKHNFDKTPIKNKNKAGQCIGVPSNIQNEFTILDKVIELKGSEFNLESKQSAKLVVDACSQLITDQSSIVKQLTNYWNNILNTDADENNIDTVSSVCRCGSTKSLEGANEITSIRSFQPGIRISNTEIRQRHLSESNINILKRLESLSSGGNNSTHIFMARSSTSFNLESNVGLEDNLRTMPMEPNICWDTPFKGTGFTAVSTTSDVCNASSSNNSIIMGNNRVDVTTDSTVMVLKNILGQLILFPEKSILSDEIGLSQPVKTMLCLMTATWLTKPDTYNHVSSVELQDHTMDNGKELEVHKRKPENKGWDDIEDHLSDTSYSQCTTVAIPKITLKQVESAVSILSLCKDFVWMRSILSDHFINRNEDYFNFPSCSYTFTYEEHVVLEEDVSNSDQGEEDYDEQNEFKKKSCPICESLSRFFNYIVNTAEDVVDGVINRYIQPYLPNSIEGFVKMVYQVLVSILIWQVIAKEFLSK